LANTSRLDGYNVPLAQQVISIVQKEHIVGVLGWRRSSSCLQVIGDLAKHSIPLLSVTAISDELTNISPYFFRVVAPNTVHTRVAAHFATAPKPHGLNAKNAVIFFDHRDSHSLNIAGHFKSDFEKNGGTILPGLNVAYFDKKPVQGVFFTSERTDRKEFSLLVEQVLTKNPAVNLIYFAGIGHQDAVEFQNALPPMEKYPDLRVVSVDTSYITEANARDRWYFTTYTYHGQWSTLTKDHNIAPSPFLGPHGNDGEYQQNFDPYLKHGATPYDNSIPDATAITSYDGLMALTLAIKDVMARKDAQNITSQDVAKALRQVAFQGVSGYISFGGDKSNGDPVNKSIVMLLAASQGIGMLCIGGGPFYPGVDQTAYNCPE